ncbi:SDR family NAD(P)-dependent oxidoreductase [Asticcacaulis taihuensis]|uniref:SDR family NAD(P)-dependent oxidoreductase n=1 Tax=Asticcacaulis taihuensis TaxID=260084 RepID=UPI003F7C86D6
MPAKTYLITGASSGIGAQFARSYARGGINLILVARRLDRLETLAAELTAAHGVTVTCLDADLSDRAQVNGLVVRIREMNLRPDGLINNAGYSLAHTFAATTAQQQLDFIEVCVAAPTLLARELLDHMLAQGFGRIINVSSMVAFSPGASGHTLYPAAKAYMLKFSRSLAAEVAGRGVKVTALCPGSTESEFQHSNGMDAVLKTHPVRFVQTAEAVVEAAIRANEAGREVIVTGWTNKLAVFLMTYIPDGLITPLIRWGAQKYQLKD